MLIRDELAKRYGLADCCPLTMATVSIRDEMVARGCGLREAVLNLLAECQEEHSRGLFFEGKKMETTEIVDRWDVVVYEGPNAIGIPQDSWLDCYTWEAMALIQGFNRRAKKERRPLRAKLIRAGQRWDVELITTDGEWVPDRTDCSTQEAAAVCRAFHGTEFRAYMVPRKS